MEDIAQQTSETQHTMIEVKTEKGVAHITNQQSAADLIHIYNMSGQCVYKVTLSAQSEITIPLAQGRYVLKMSTADVEISIE
ncbi:MAG: T9SS type A sorting domain-containing protein [Alloprevotella tannerae]|nr:T9SS type A sorting domain-containing protein [Alloprevotella tannerae]MBF0960587.1 T9SS type A sorting domain-containing protein [Alloprevotella tannerae]